MSLSTETTAVPAAGRHAHSYLEWAPIFGGAVLSAAIFSIMAAFGSAIGLSLISVEPSRSSNFTVLAIVSALWALWIGVSSSGAGAYLAGRMRRPAGDATAHERSVRDAAHGLVVWAAGVLLVTILTTSSLLGGAKSIVAGASSVASGAASLVTQQLDPLATSIDGLMRTTGPAAQQGSGDRDSTTRIFVNSLSAGTLDPGDRTYLASQVATRANIPQADAEKRVDEAFAKLMQAKETAKQAAERARKIAIMTAFLTAAGLLVSGAAAWMAAMLGGKHRDEEMDLSHLFGRR